MHSQQIMVPSIPQNGCSSYCQLPIVGTSQYVFLSHVTAPSVSLDMQLVSAITEMNQLSDALLL